MAIPEFVLALRERVGTDLLWLPGVTGVVRDDAGRVLLVKRADTGRWALISGILEPGEEPAAGLVREVLEETGVDVVVTALTGISVTPPETYSNGDRSQYLDLCFLCRTVSSSSAAAAHPADDESTDVGWYHLTALPGDLEPSSEERLGHALAHLVAPARGTHFAV